MTDYELSAMLNISVPEAHEFIQQCDRLDRFMESLYDLEAVDRYERGLDELIESADWDFDLYEELDA
jgi:hypothetical protein